jgi:hypothetical protein
VLAKPVMRVRSFRPKKIVPITAQQKTPKQTIEKRLERLNAMQIKGLITKEEAAKKRAQILKGL